MNSKPKVMELKPRLLDIYIIRKFILTFFIALILIIGIVIIFDISEKIDDFVSKEAPLKAIIFDYYLNFIPYFVNMFSPLFVFITVIFFTSKMAADSEIVAILSCGISFHRMMVPYIISATLIAILSLGLNLFVIPRSNEIRVEFESKYIKGHNKTTVRDIHYQIAPGEFVFVESFSSWNNTAHRFTLEKVEKNRLVSKLSAQTAVWDSLGGCWKLKKYFIRDYSSSLSDQVRSGAQLDTVIASYTYNGASHDITVRSAIESEYSLESAQNSDGTYSVPSAETIISTVRNNILVSEAESRGIEVSDDEMDQFAESMLGSSDYATLATQYGVTEDQAKEIVRERALIQKLYSQVVPEASTATAPTEPTAPENGDTSTSSAEYAQYIIDLAGDEWDSENNTWASTDGSYYLALGDAFTGDTATYEQAVTAYYVAYQEYSNQMSGYTTTWTDFANGLFANANIRLYGVYA